MRLATELVDTQRMRHLIADAMRDNKTLPMLCVYDHPRDFPDKFVVRLYLVGEGDTGATPYAMVADTLAEAREMVPGGFTCLTRNAGDDPVIVETWI